MTAPKGFKPMLSATMESVASARYPLYLSPKLDGIRCVVFGGVAYSRNLKPIPNRHVQKLLSVLPDGMDGELIVGEPNASDVWNATQSGVMSSDGEPAGMFHVFDRWVPDQPDLDFHTRLRFARVVTEDFSDVCVMVPHHRVSDEQTLAAFENHYVGAGYEGVMLRCPSRPYKFGRATLREGGLAKLKRWFDAEAVVVGFVERQHNGNEATTDELGRTKRSSHKAGKSGRNDLGALICEFSIGGDKVGFELGTGFTDEQRRAIWSDQKTYLGRRVTFKFQTYTPDGAPRFPVFMRWFGAEQ